MNWSNQQSLYVEWTPRPPQMSNCWSWSAALATAVPLCRHLARGHDSDSSGKWHSNWSLSGWKMHTSLSGFDGWVLPPNTDRKCDPSLRLMASIVWNIRASFVCLNRWLISAGFPTATHFRSSRRLWHLVRPPKPPVIHKNPPTAALAWPNRIISECVIDQLTSGLRLLTDFSSGFSLGGRRGPQPPFAAVKML